uniref:Inosine triphosphate pyrophosphatase n=1 Tax=Tetraselmis sp. GSL018 TaxID=582737 RepID=A0A061R7H4_9CHLO
MPCSANCVSYRSSSNSCNLIRPRPSWASTPSRATRRLCSSWKGPVSAKSVLEKNMPNTIYFATGNKKKLEEVVSILSSGSKLSFAVEPVKLELPELQVSAITVAVGALLLTPSLPTSAAFCKPVFPFRSVVLCSKYQVCSYTVSVGNFPL